MIREIANSALAIFALKIARVHSRTVRRDIDRGWIVIDRTRWKIVQISCPDDLYEIRNLARRSAAGWPR